MSLSGYPKYDFRRYENFRGNHSFLSPSKTSWLHYSESKLLATYRNHLNIERGNKLHEIAAELIENKINLPRNKKTLNNFVNDAIGYTMETEVVLFYSVHCFGTCDAITFKRNTLRIFDLKTGVTPAKPEQLVIYAALFCLQYNTNPESIEYDLRIYQSDEVLRIEVEPKDVQLISDQIIAFSHILEREV